MVRSCNALTGTNSFFLLCTDSIRISELVCDTTPSIGFFVLCTSVDSPVQSITWEKNGMALIADGGHVIRQELVYGSKVQYNNQLYVLDGTESKSPDVYSCVVTDHFGNTIRKDISCACEGNMHDIVSVNPLHPAQNLTVQTLDCVYLYCSRIIHKDNNS